MKFISATLSVTIVVYVLAEFDERQSHYVEKQLSADSRDELLKDLTAVNGEYQRRKRSISQDQVSATVRLSYPIKSNAEIVRPSKLTLPNGTTAFELLQQAAHHHPCYMFQYKSFRFGRYITSICCLAENSTTNFYWLLYVNGVAAQVGVDQLMLKDGDVISFQYQHSSSHGRNATNTVVPTASSQNMSIVSVALIFSNFEASKAVPTLNLTVAPQKTAFQLLELASEENPCYNFEYKSFSFGRYVTTICCVAENTTTNYYWSIYLNGALSSVGIEDLVPKNGDVLTFRYEMVNPTDHTTPSNTTPTGMMSKDNGLGFSSTPTGMGSKDNGLGFNFNLFMAFGSLAFLFSGNA